MSFRTARHCLAVLVSGIALFLPGRFAASAGLMGGQDEEKATQSADSLPYNAFSMIGA
jgi:hypothetical protein